MSNKYNWFHEIIEIHNHSATLRNMNNKHETFLRELIAVSGYSYWWE